MSAFVGVGAAPGQKLWRIEGGELVAMQIEGKFFTGSSYLLLSTEASQLGALKQSIHIWNGRDTYEQEWKESIQFANQLEEALEGSLVVYREVENCESPLFASYFKQLSIEYVPGQCPAGSSSFNRSMSPELLLVRGKHVARVSHKQLSNSSLTQSNVFILTTEQVVYIYSGKLAGQYEKAKAAEFAASIRKERPSASLTYIDDEPDNAIFWKLLGGMISAMSLPTGVEEDLVAGPEHPRLFKIEVDGGKANFVVMAENGSRVTKEMLNGDGTHLFHGSIQGIASNILYVWVGLGASDDISNESLSHALEYLSESGTSPHTVRIEKVYENAESQNFIKDFAHWHFKSTETRQGTPERNRSRSLTPTPSINPRRMSMLISYEDVLVSANIDTAPVPEGGELKMWRVDNFKLNSIPEKKIGQFYSGDCYVTQYKVVLPSGKEQTIIYFWIGSHSSSDDKAAAVVQAKELDEGLGNIATQVKVVEGREPIHFRSLFKGSMVVHRRGKISGYKEKSNNWKAVIQSVALYQVHASAPIATHATQVPLIAASLNSADCFALITEINVFLWVGKGSSETERASAEEIANVMVSSHWMYVSLDIVEEGSEPEEFWTYLEGKTEYPSDRDPVDYRTIYCSPRLFHASNSGGDSLRVEEIENFDQSDLQEDAVMLLDAYSEVYAWIGKNSNEKSKDLAIEYAAQYINASSVNIDRPEATTVVVQSGVEPTLFTQHFKGWDPNFSRNYVNPYQSNSELLAIAAKKALDAPKRLRANTNELLPYEQLKDTVVDGIPPDRKEEYIDDETFEALFRVKREEFAKLARWRKDKMKKQVGLF